MAIVDKLLEFSDAQALTATADSDNSIDLSVPTNRQVGVGNDIYLVVRVDVAADDGSANETYEVQLETDSVVAFSSAADIGGAIDIPRGSPAGTKFVQSLPRSGVEQFLQLRYTLGGTTPSVTLTAYLTPEKEEGWTPYPEGQN